MFFFPEKKKSKGKSKEYNCETCGLDKTKQVKLFVGERYNGLVIVGDYPGNQELEKEKPFVGKSGQLLRTLALRNKINLAKDSAITNALLCKPGKMSSVYIKCCRKILKKNLTNLKPKLIVCLGEYAANSVLNTDEKQSIGKLRNRIIPNYEFNCLVFCAYNPATLLWKDSEDKIDKTREQCFNWDLERIFKLWNRKYYKKREIKKILRERNILKDFESIEIKTKRQLNKVIIELLEAKRFGFDYETTNTKPFDDYFDIYSLSFGLRNKSYSVYIPDFEDIKYLKERVYELLNNEILIKDIQNKSFEELCSRWWLNKPKQRIINNVFDPMLATHIIDEREGTKSLDFQNLVRFGMPFYSNAVKPFLKKKNKNDKCNTIHLCDKHELQKYNNLDTKSDHENALILDQTLLDKEPKYRDFYNFFCEIDDAFTDLQETGFPIDIKRLEEINIYLENEMDKILEEINNISEVKKYLKKLIKEGFKEKKDKGGGILGAFLRSPKKVQEFLYKELKLKPFKKTNKSIENDVNYSTDEEVILHHAEVDNNEFCKKLVKHRKIEKAKGTYIDNIRRNTNEDNRVHASFLAITTTLRSVAIDPPLLTIPKHGEIVEGIPWTLISEVFTALNMNYILGQCDYSGFELFIGAALSGDPKFIKDVNEIDVHAKEAVRLWELDCDPNDLKKLDFEYGKGKDIRFEMKNNCVFASVYGANFNSIAQNLRTVKEFIAFCQKKYEQDNTNLSFNNWIVDFSNEWVKYWQQELFFGDYNQLKTWQDSEVQFYYDNKYSELSILGFRRRYPLTRNEIINGATQHGACIVLYDSMIKINKELKERRKQGFRTEMVLEVHDDLRFNVHKTEIIELIDLVDNIMLKPDLNKFPFLKPMKLKTEWSFGHSLAKMKEI